MGGGGGSQQKPRPAGGDAAVAKMDWQQKSYNKDDNDNNEPELLTPNKKKLSLGPTSLNNKDGDLKGFFKRSKKGKHDPTRTSSATVYTDTMLLKRR